MSEKESLSLALKPGGTGGSREADWVDLIGADTFGAIFQRVLGE